MDTRGWLHIPKGAVEAALAAAPTSGKKNLEPFGSLMKQAGVPMQIVEDVDVVTVAEVHRTQADLWFCLEGDVTFVLGGELVDPFHRKVDGIEDPHEIRANEIRGGEEMDLRPGDWLWIPPGMPHRHKTKSVARMMVIKVPR